MCGWCGHSLIKGSHDDVLVDDGPQPSFDLPGEAHLSSTICATSMFSIILLVALFCPFLYFFYILLCIIARTGVEPKVYFFHHHQLTHMLKTDFMLS